MNYNYLVKQNKKLNITKFVESILMSSTVVAFDFTKVSFFEYEWDTNVTFPSTMISCHPSWKASSIAQVDASASTTMTSQAWWFLCNLQAFLVSNCRIHVQQDLAIELRFPYRIPKHLAYFARFLDFDASDICSC